MMGGMPPGADLPYTMAWPFAPWPALPRGGHVVEFRLVYDGWLPPESSRDTRSAEKHAIRRVFAAQLRVLWETHPRLRRDTQHGGHSPTAWTQGQGNLMEGEGGRTYYIQRLPTVSTRLGRRFVPLIAEANGVGCALDILFLRRDPPGALIKSGGDLDNRIKVLFDALRMPGNDTEVHGALVDEPDPFYCLLEDDRLIVDLKVTTDRLLTPQTTPADHAHNVHLVIHVKTIVIDPGNLEAVSF